MHSIGFETPVNEWFDFKVPRTQIKSNFIELALMVEPLSIPKPSAKPIWLGGTPLTSTYSISKKGKRIAMTQWVMHTKDNCTEINLEEAKAEWFMKQLEVLSIYNKQQLTLSELKSDYESLFDNFEVFWYSNPITTLKDTGLLLI